MTEINTNSVNAQLADFVQVEHLNHSEDFVFLKRVASGSSGETTLTFDSTVAQEWKIALSAENNTNVVVRGVEFFSQGTQFYPPVPVVK